MLKSYDELRKLDLSQYIEKRENIDYINWARIVDLLHENGAEKVYFEPVANDEGSSLYMTNQTYTDSKGNVNRVYETAVHIVIDDLDWIQRGPVMNGSNPVKDNSMSNNDKASKWDDLSYHDITKIKERCQEEYTKLLKAGLSVKDIAEKLHKTEDEVKAIFSYFDTLNTFEKDLLNIDTKSR